MSDCFLADVVTWNPLTGEGRIRPLIVEADGSNHQIVTAKSVSGISPGVGDTVLVVESRNNLDNKTVSRFFRSSATNSRIIGVVKKSGGPYVFKGDYRFNGDVLFDGDVDVTGNAVIDGDLDVDDLTVNGDATLDGDLDVAGNLSVDGSSTFNGIAFASHTHAVTGVGVNTGPPV